MTASYHYRDPEQSSKYRGGMAVIGVAAQLPFAIPLLEGLNVRVGGQAGTERPNVRSPRTGFHPCQSARLGPETFPDDSRLERQGLPGLCDPAIEPETCRLIRSSWACLEDAGYVAAALAGTGVYVGHGAGPFLSHMPGSHKFASSISRFFDFNGPSVQSDITHSSLLATVCQAVQALRSGLCELALVVGSHADIGEREGSEEKLSEANKLALPVSKQETSSATNAVLIAAFLLKPLEKAMRDGDQIHAVIRGGATGHSGRMEIWSDAYLERQAQLVAVAHDDSAIDQPHPAYLAMSGSGLLRHSQQIPRFIKRGFGHLHTGGIVSTQECRSPGSTETTLALLQTISCFRHASLFETAPEKGIGKKADNEASRLHFNGYAASWEADDSKARVAGLYHVDEEGCHAYVLLEEPSSRGEERMEANTGRAIIVPLSAASTPHLIEYAKRLIDVLRAGPKSLPEVGFTLQTGRTLLNVRVAFVATSMDELVHQLACFIEGRTATSGIYLGNAEHQSAGIAHLHVDDGLQGLLEDWIAKDRLGNIAALWAAGLTVDWSKLYPGNKPARTSLPAYAFDFGLSQEKGVHADGTVSERTRSASPPGHLKGTDFNKQDIAIIGMSCRFPNSANIEEFWKRLSAGENCIREIPENRWDWRQFHSEEKGQWGKIYSKWGGFIDDIDCFDPLFFNISPKDAEEMDPQERLFLQEAYACIEDAGYVPGNICPSRKVGVFVAVMNSAYSLVAEHWSIANRVSSVLDLHGPSLAIDTACSSSLTALHYACESIYRGHSECAIVGGVSLIVDPVLYMRVSARTMITSGDKCRSFGADADGFVDAEGIGAVLIKPLELAVRDGDHIYGVIKGTAVNHGGKTRGYNVPSPVAQAEVISSALSEAGVHPRAISYVEAHGTGTLRGDPIEISGLTAAYAQFTSDTQYCAIGSVKSNIGHCESAAGMAGLVKLLLQLRHRTIVKSLHSKELNPRIDFTQTPFVVQQEKAPWRRPVLNLDGEEREYPRLASLSSFGGGGSNAHAILEEYIPAESRQERKTVQPVIVVLSAKNEARLQEQAGQLLEAIERRNLADTDLKNLAWTLQSGREAMDVRLACVVDKLQELKAYLENYRLGQTSQNQEGLYYGETKKSHDTVSLFAADEDLQQAMASWVAKGKLAKLAQLWVRGMAIDWSMLYGMDKPRRMSLPTYPFAKERYWKRNAVGNSVVVNALPAISEWSAPAPAAYPAPAPQGRKTSDREGIQQFLAEELSAALIIPANFIDYSRPFPEYGMDSVVGMKLLRKLESEFGVCVASRELIENFTISSLADLVVEKVKATELPAEPRSGGHVSTDILSRDAESDSRLVSEIDINQMEALKLFKDGHMELDELNRILAKEGVL